MSLLVEDRIPPDIQQPVRPRRSPREETPQIKPTTILGHDDVDAVRVAVSVCGQGLGVEVVGEFRSERVARGAVGRVLDSEGVEGVDVAVGGGGETVEDVGLEGVSRLHYEGVEVEPPEPCIVISILIPSMHDLVHTIRHSDTSSWSSG